MSERGPTRTFIDWTAPLLPEAARRVIARGDVRQGAIDLRRWMLILPGRRAGRLMLSFLLEEAERRGVALVPPRIATPGTMLDFLVPVGGDDGAPAPDEAVIAAWVHALREVDDADRAPILPSPPEPDDWTAWQSVARTIHRVQVDLAGEDQSFADVVRATAALDLPRERERWAALERLEQTVHQQLDAERLIEPHTARRELVRRAAIDDRALDCLIVIGVPEMNRIQKRVLEVLAEKTEIITFAPTQEEDRFDAFGCVMPARWRDWRPSVRDEQIITADGAAEQAQAAMDGLASIVEGTPQVTTADITIGLGEESLAPTLSRAARWAGLRAHDAAGTPLNRSGPARFLEAAANWLREPRFAHLATLLRHPEVEAWLQRNDAPGGPAARESWLTLLDRYFAAHLHDRLEHATFLGSGEEQRAMKLVHDRVQSLLASLAGAAQPLRAWDGAIREVLSALYGELEEHDQLPESADEACVELVNAMAALAALPDSLQPIVRGDVAIRLLLDAVRSQHLPQERRADAIEMIGWLELALDPAPHLILTGVHDGAIPSRADGDAFLPDSIRRSLGLMDNDRRAARDAYLFETMLRSKQSLLVIAGRRDARGEPLTPSRLLLAGDDETVLRRVRRLCGDESPRAATLPRGLAVPAEVSRFTVPDLPEDLPAPSHMNVTDFRLYIDDPYRYALAKLLRLEPIRIEAFEMDPLLFGSLAHQVLERFGNDPAVRDEREPAPIRTFLLDTLSKLACERFGEHPLPAVRVQLARLEQRFRDFADKQARWRMEGWRIEAVERRFRDEIALEIPGEDPMPLRASIDRIDRHESTGVVRIIDYKTSESGDGPHETHHGKKLIPDPLEWIDLQLPLYHHLLERAGFDLARGVEIGYIVLPKQTDGAAFRAAAWSAEQLASAVETAREIVRNIRAGEFPRDPTYVSAFDPWARLCHAQVITALDDAEEDDGGEGAA